MSSLWVFPKCQAVSVVPAQAVACDFRKLFCILHLFITQQLPSLKNASLLVEQVAAIFQAALTALLSMLIPGIFCCWWPNFRGFMAVMVTGLLKLPWEKSLKRASLPSSRGKMKELRDRQILSWARQPELGAPRLPQGTKVGLWASGLY